MKKILLVDFDGVIHSYTSPWTTAAEIPDPPVEGAIAFLLGALKEYEVMVFSSRSHQPGGISAMRRWLREHGAGAWHETPDGPGLEDISFPTVKPPAFLTIDDRCIRFTGDWPSMEEIKAFKPWNKP